MPTRALGALLPLAATAALTAALAPAPAAAAAEPPNNPGRPVAGDLRVHDPALLRGGPGEPWYVFGTGDGAYRDGTLQIRSSADGYEWRLTGTVWDRKPDWITREIPGVDNLWAPEIHEEDGTYYLYYAASTFGSNRSLIGLATNTTLDPDDPDYRWVDRGKVFESFPGDPYNAIDPGIVVGADGRHWMTFGSFWSGIRMVELDWPSGKAKPGAPVLHLADRQQPPNAIEAPAVLYRDGWYYLFVSLDHCCQGSNSTYKIAVGRARDVTGPYRDRWGRSMLQGGGTVIASRDWPIVGAGGQSVSGGLLAYHYYDASLGGDFRLALHPLSWTWDGWPRLD